MSILKKSQKNKLHKTYFLLTINCIGRFMREKTEFDVMT